MPAFPYRGLMLDPARTMERQEYYHFLLPWLKEWGYNVLHLHLLDDQGGGLAFPHHPDLASPGAFTADEMRTFVRAAARHGIQVIPEIESLGHTRRITRLTRFRHLGGGPADGFNAINPDHPDTRRVLSDLFDDTAEIFDSPIIHAGLDEVNFSVLPSYRTLPREEHWEVFARHTAWVHEAIRRRGRRPAMWGDHILSAPTMAERFQRDVLIFDWHYDPDFSPRSLDFFHTHRFEVWGAPATLCWRARVVSNSGNLANTREFAACALAYRRRGLTGMVNTVWCPWRYLSGAMDWPIALAGHLFSAADEDPAFCAHFCRSFYGLPAAGARQAAEAIRRLHEAAPWSGAHTLILTGRGYAGEPFTREHRRRSALLAAEMQAVAAALHRVLPGARRNRERLHDVLLSARILARVGAFGAAGRRRRGLPSAGPLWAQCVAAWNRVRPEPWTAYADKDDFTPADNVIAALRQVL